MARPLRLEFADALYHVTSRGNERRSIFRTIRDRQQFLLFLGIAVKRFGWSFTTWVLMTNHDHLVIQTPEPDLSDALAQQQARKLVNRDRARRSIAGRAIAPLRHSRLDKRWRSTHIAIDLPISR